MAVEYIPNSSVFMLSNLFVNPTTTMVPQRGVINARYPQENLLNQRRSVPYRWRTPYPVVNQAPVGNGNWAVAIFDLGAAVIPNGFALIDCNTSAAVAGATFIGMTTSDPWADIPNNQGYAVNTYDPGRSGVQAWYCDAFDNGVSAPRRFWAVFLIAPPKNNAAYWELGVAMIGTRTEYAVSIGFTGEGKDYSDDQVLPTGGRWYDKRPVGRNWTMTLPVRANLDAVAMQESLLAAGASSCVLADLHAFNRTEPTVRNSGACYGNLATGRIFRVKQQTQMYQAIDIELDEAVA